MGIETSSDASEEHASRQRPVAIAATAMDRFIGMERKFMSSIRHATRSRAALYGAAAALIITLASGCSSILGTDRSTAETVRVVVTGQSPVPLQLVTSTRFARAFNDDGEEQIRLIVADTAHVSPPVDRTVSFGTADRFAVMLINPSSEATADVTMTVTVDGKEVYRQSATLRDASLRFTYYLF